MPTTAAVSIAREFEFGVVETPAPNQVIPLVNPEEAWVVGQGKLDLFLAAWVDGEATGARRPVMRVDTGGIATGIDPVGGVTLIACPAPGTKVARVRLGSLYGKQMNADTPVSLVEGWICGLAEALGAGGTPLLSPLCIANGESVVVGESSTIISSKNRNGASNFLGRIHVNGDSGLFPLARQCWMESTPGAEVYAAHASEHEALDPEWNGLHKFCGLALGILTERFHEAAKADRERMQAKVNADRQLLDRSIHRLAAPVQKVVEFGDGDDTCSHPVFLACRMLASRMGFEVRPHPILMRGIPVKDPVNAIARASNVRVRRVTLKGEWWKSETGGLLCFLEESNAPVAILASKKGLDVYNRS